MKKKICYFDVETTGMDPKKQDIIQLSGMIEIDGEIVDRFNLRIRPFDFDAIDPRALEVNGITVDQLRTYPGPREQYLALTEILSRHVQKFNPNDKYYPAGFNVKFDVDFLKAFFEKNGDKYFGSFFNYRMIDPLPILCFKDAVSTITVENFKLSTICHYYDIPIQAHDAMSDIEATYTLIKKLQSDIITK